MIKQNKTPNMKSAFSMVTAIFVIVIMATVTALIMNVTGKSIKETTAQYQKEQAALLARSYTEQAMLYALNYDRTAKPDCINTIHATFGDNNTSQLFTIQTDLQYASNDSQLPVACNSIARWADDGTAGFNSTVSLIIDVYVSYIDNEDPSGRSITLHRRTLQKL